VLRARPALALLPVGEVLHQAGSQLRAVRRVPVHFDDAQAIREPPQEAQASALRPPRRIGIVEQIGVLRVPEDRILDDGGAGGAQGLFADLLGEVVEGVVHGRSAAPMCTTSARIWGSKSLRKIL